MSNARAMGVEVESRESVARERVPGAAEIDPAILAAIGSPNRPVHPPKLPTLPKTIPGEEGVLVSVAGVFQNVRRGVEYALEFRERHGDFIRATFVGMPIVIVWDADEIHKILRNEDRAWSTAMGWDTFMFGGLDPHAGNTGTLLALDFDDHRVARKLVQPAFTPRALEGYLEIADRSFAAQVAEWSRRGDVPFKRKIRTLLARVANDIFTGIRDPDEVAVVDRALNDFWNGMFSIAKNPWISPKFRRARSGLATMIEKFVALVPERRKAGGKDLLSQMCAVTDTEGLDDEALVRVFITVMFGAFDTTSAGMASMGYFLAKHPEWQDRLRDEARRVSAGPPDVAAMKEMKLHEWVWKETLRLMPVNGFVPRRALREVTVGGHTVPAGAMVCPMNGGIGRHPKWWKEPAKFDPERFSPERAEDKQHPGIYNPFGAGVHACVGMQLANMEMKLFWHRMLTSCSFRLTRDYDARHTFGPFGIVSGDVALTLEPLSEKTAG